MLALVASPLPPSLDALGDYSNWFIVAGVVVLAVMAVWILLKLLKWFLRILLVSSLILGTLFLAWLFLH